MPICLPFQNTCHSSGKVVKGAFQKNAHRHPKNLDYVSLRVYLCIRKSASIDLKAGKIAKDIRLIAVSHKNHILLYYINVHKNIARCLYSPCKGFGEPGTHKTTLPCGRNAPKSHFS